MKLAILKILILIAAFAGGWFTRGWLHPQDTNVQFRFVTAARSGDVAEMEKLYRAGAKIDGVAFTDDRCCDSGPAIIAAADGGHARAVEWLLNHNANPNLPYIDAAPLGCASGHLAKAEETVALLKKFGAK